MQAGAEYSSEAPGALDNGVSRYYWPLKGEGQEPDDESDSGLPFALAYRDFHHCTAFYLVAPELSRKIFILKNLY